MLLGIVSIISLLLILLTVLVVIPVETIASDQFRVDLLNETDSTVIVVGLQYDDVDETYHVVNSVRRPLLFAVIYSLFEGDSKTIGYDMWDTGEALYFLGVGENHKKYFAIFDKEGQEVVFNESAQLIDSIVVNKLPYWVVIFHGFLVIFFCFCWIFLKKYLVKKGSRLVLLRFPLFFLAGINLLCAIGYFVLIIFVNFYLL